MTDRPIPLETDPMTDRPIDAAVDFVKLLALVALVAVFGTLSETPTLLVPECDRPRGGKASVV